MTNGETEVQRDVFCPRSHKKSKDKRDFSFQSDAGPLQIYHFPSQRQGLDSPAEIGWGSFQVLPCKMGPLRVTVFWEAPAQPESPVA